MFSLIEKHLHPHLMKRMKARGINKEEIEDVVNFGSDLSDAKTGTYGKVRVFSFNKEWKGKKYKEKECVFIIKLYKMK